MGWVILERWGEQLFTAADLRALSVLVASPHLPRPGTQSDRTRGAAALAAAPHLSNLSSLDVSDNDIGDAGASALATAPHLPRLTFLDLRSNPIGESTAAHLRAR